MNPRDWLEFVDQPDAAFGAEAALAAATGFRQFVAFDGHVRGLARVDDMKLLVLAIIADPPGVGLCRAFVDRCKADFPDVAFLEVWSPVLDAHLRRHGFTPTRVRFSDTAGRAVDAEALAWRPHHERHFLVKFRRFRDREHRSQYVPGWSSQHALQRLGRGEFVRKAHSIKAPDSDRPTRWISWPWPTAAELIATRAGRPLPVPVPATPDDGVPGVDPSA